MYQRGYEALQALRASQQSDLLANLPALLARTFEQCLRSQRSSGPMTRVSASDSGHHASRQVALRTRAAPPAASAESITQDKPAQCEREPIAFDHRDSARPCDPLPPSISELAPAPAFQYSGQAEYEPAVQFRDPQAQTTPLVSCRS